MFCNAFKLELLFLKRQINYSYVINSQRCLPTSKNQTCCLLLKLIKFEGENTLWTFCIVIAQGANNLAAKGESK